MNNPPTALVGFGKPGGGLSGPCRLSMNNPTALVGFGKPRGGPSGPCRLSVNDPPTALVGFELYAQSLP
jgi:hypothetical protein